MTKPPKTMEEIKNAGADNYFIMGFELTPDKYLPMAFKAGFDCRDKLGDEALELANEIQASLLRRIDLLESEIRKLRGVNE